MLSKHIFLVVFVVGLSVPAVLGCSSDGDGEGGGEEKGLSFDEETAMPATGGASVAVDRGVAISSIISSMQLQNWPVWRRIQSSWSVRTPC